MLFIIDILFIYKLVSVYHYRDVVVQLSFFVGTKTPSLVRPTSTICVCASNAMAVSKHAGYDGNRNTMTKTTILTMTMPHASSSSNAMQVKNHIAKQKKSADQNVLRSAKSVKQMKAAHVKNKFNTHALDEACPVELPSLMQLIASSHVPAVNSNPRMTHRRIVHGWW